MAAKSKSASILGRLSRTDSEVFSRSPLAFDAGRVVWLDQFATAPQVSSALLKCKSKDEVQGLMSVLYYLTDPRSIYRNMAEAARAETVIANHVAPDARKLIGKLVESSEFKELQQFLLSLITTPSERLYLALKRQVSSYAEKVATLDVVASAADGKQIMQSIEYAQDAAERLRDMEAFLREEAKTVVRAGYEARLFEQKPE